MLLAISLSATNVDNNQSQVADINSSSIEVPAESNVVPIDVQPTDTNRTKEENTTSSQDTTLHINLNKTLKTDDNKSNSKKATTTLNILSNYDNATITGEMHTEENLTKAQDVNNTNAISPTTKLDDVSNLDIAKVKREQRKIARNQKSHEDGNTEDKDQLVDTIVVKGSVLQGRIDQLTSEYISFKLIYGIGSIRIDYADVESLNTEHEYHIYFDGKETLGTISEIKDHAFLKVKHGEVEELITISKIDRVIVSEREDDSVENQLRNMFPYWSGSVDVGLEYEAGNLEKRKAKLESHIERKRSEYKTIFDVAYAYESTKTVDTPNLLTKHELYSFLEQNYLFTTDDLLFAEIGYDFDEPRFVNNRLYPSVGYGYHLATDKSHWVQFKVGGGFVYEDFLSYDENSSASSNQYLAGLFAVDASYKFEDLMLVNSIVLGVHFFYMPGIRSLKENWLFRYSITGSIPISKILALKAVAKQVSDDNPSPDIGNNKLTFDLYLSLNF